METQQIERRSPESQAARALVERWDRGQDVAAA